MTTTPNDAAVNAESAAKLVSDLLEGAECLLQGDVHPGSKRARDLAMNIREYIERHATPQTQATHGEGEAKYDYCAKHRRWPCAECGTSHYAGCDCPICAPSPTAAPALGELVKNANHEMQTAGLHGLKDRETYYAGVLDGLHQAAAALSGVAAQGDGT
jgi:hypothetical protein